MAKLLDRISKDLNAQGYTRRSQEARKWLQKTLQNLGSSKSRSGLVNDPQRTTGSHTLGLFNMFFYDPKLKLTLPYYDRFPLVLPIEGYSDGFLGLNFHYLPINLRVHLLDKLYDLTNNTNFDETTRIQASYSVLKGAARYKEFKPCLKRYLTDHIESRIIAIEPDSWETCIFLPVQMFAKTSAQAVWADSRRIINNG